MVQLLETRPPVLSELLEPSDAAVPREHPASRLVAPNPPEESASHVLVYGDFVDPWSYLASRRAALLAADGVDVEWRAVERHPRGPGDRAGGSPIQRLREKTEEVLTVLLPGEQLPYALAGFVPDTKPAVSGYAEAFAAGVGTRVQQRLFEAFWMHGFDLGAPEAVRLLLVDDIRSGSSPSEPLREWGYAVDATGGPLTTAAWRLVRRWSEAWRKVGEEPLPVVVVDGGAPRYGVEAVSWLGDELLRRDVALDEPAVRPSSEAPLAAPLEARLAAPVAAPVPAQSLRDLAPYSWVSENGNRWLRDYQRAHRTPVLPEVG